MRDGPQDYAVGLVIAAEQMRRMGAERIWALYAIAASRVAKRKPPRWAMDALLLAVDEAIFSNDILGKRISLDKALGLGGDRSRKRPEDRLKRMEHEQHLFEHVGILKACFDVSTDKACERVYNMVDVHGARDLDDAQSALTGRPRTFDRILEICAPNDEVLQHYRRGAWWSVTCGEKLGYSVDHFIQRFHRVGTKRADARFRHTEDPARCMRLLGAIYQLASYEWVGTPPLAKITDGLRALHPAKPTNNQLSKTRTYRSSDTKK